MTLQEALDLVDRAIDYVKMDNALGENPVVKHSPLDNSLAVTQYRIRNTIPELANSPKCKDNVQEAVKKCSDEWEEYYKYLQEEDEEDT